MRIVQATRVFVASSREQRALTSLPFANQRDSEYVVASPSDKAQILRYMSGFDAVFLFRLAAALLERNVATHA